MIPALSETARIADIHLPIRPGTDGLLLKAMISIILQEGLENKSYLAEHTSGFDQVKSLFLDFDARAAVRTCELDFEKVREVARLFATRKSSMRHDLGIYMNRHSAVNSYQIVILKAICGRIGVPGGNVFNGHMMPIGAHTDERNPEDLADSGHKRFPGLRDLSAQCDAGGNPLRSPGPAAGSARDRIKPLALVCGYDSL